MASRLRQTSLAGGSLGTDHFSQNVFFLWMDFFRQVSLALIFFGNYHPPPALCFSRMVCPLAVSEEEKKIS